jgi:hypothetical protein
MSVDEQGAEKQAAGFVSGDEANRNFSSLALFLHDPIAQESLFVSLVKQKLLEPNELVFKVHSSSSHLGFSAWQRMRRRLWFSIFALNGL